MQASVVSCTLVRPTLSLATRWVVMPRQGVVLNASTEEKDVGVIIHNSLKPAKQCAKAASKANQILGQMMRAFHYRDKYTWIRLYKTYVRCHLEYSVQAWNP